MSRLADMLRTLAAALRPGPAYRAPGAAVQADPAAAVGDTTPEPAKAADARLRAILKDAIGPAEAILSRHGITSGTLSRQMMLAITGQEADSRHRVQIVTGGGRGPARGLWQFERGGGVQGVLAHPATKAAARALCEARGVAPESREAWTRLEFDDVLAAGFARLLLWSDPAPLPRMDDPDAGWRLYIRTWRPGKPHMAQWARHWTAAKAALA